MLKRPVHHPKKEYINTKTRALKRFKARMLNAEDEYFLEHGHLPNPKKVTKNAVRTK